MSRPDIKARFSDIQKIFVEEKSLADNLVQCIKRGSFAFDQEVSAYVKSFGGVYCFSETFQVWLDEQLRPFLHPKKIRSGALDDKPVLSRPTSAADGSDFKIGSIAEADQSVSKAQNTPQVHVPVSKEAEMDSMLRALGQTMHIKQKKPKKRLAPTTLSEAPRATGSEAEADVRFQSIAISPIDQFGITIPLDKIPKSHSMSEAAATNTAGEESSRCGFGDNVNQINDQNDKVASLEHKPLTLTIDTNLSNKSIGHNSWTDDHNNGNLSADDLNMFARMGAVYAALLVHLYIPFAVGVPFLAKLLGFSSAKVGSDVSSGSVFKGSIHLHVFAAKAVESSLPLFGHLGPELAIELSNCIPLQMYCLETACFLKNLGEDLAVSKLIDGRSKGSEYMMSQSSMDDQDADRKYSFIRPFHADFDDRNQYKTQIESTIFNEREKLYDDVSELYRKYQDTVSSDLDGSKVDGFWVYMSRVCLKMLTSLRDCNFSWFAELFVNMLLHYGTNISTASSNLSVRSSPVVEPVLTDQRESIKASATAELGNPEIKGSVHSNQRTTPTNISNNGNAKHRMLEARMGPGGIGASTGIGRGTNRIIRPSTGSIRQAVGGGAHQVSSDSGHYHGHRVAAGDPSGLGTASTYSNNFLSQPALLFPGNQQFFFRFVILADNYRFCQHLKIFFLSSVDHITQTALNAITGGDHVALCIHKLSILGRFLGLVHFWPDWVLSLPKESMNCGPLAQIVEKSIDVRNSSFLTSCSGLVPLLDIVQTSIKEKRFCFTVPWVTEFLKLMSWDTVSNLNAMNIHATQRNTNNLGSSPIRQELSCVHYLVMLLFADRQILEHEALSSNIVYIIYTLEDFVGSLPQSLRHVDRRGATAAALSSSGGLLGLESEGSALKQELSALKFSRSSMMQHVMDVDSKNLAFVRSDFNEMLAPFVSRAIRYLRYPRGATISRSRSASSTGYLSHCSVPPQMASLKTSLSNNLSVVNQTSGHDHAISFLPLASPLKDTELTSSGTKSINGGNISRALFSSSPNGFTLDDAKGSRLQAGVCKDGAHTKSPEPLNFNPVGQASSSYLSPVSHDRAFVPAPFSSDMSSEVNTYAGERIDEQDDSVKLADVLTVLDYEDEACIFIVRRISKLGYTAQGHLHAHFSKFGPVKHILFSQPMPTKNH